MSARLPGHGTVFPLDTLTYFWPMMLGLAGLAALLLRAPVSHVKAPTT